MRYEKNVSGFLSYISVMHAHFNILRVIAETPAEDGQAALVAGLVWHTQAKGHDIGVVA